MNVHLSPKQIALKEYRAKKQRAVNKLIPMGN